MRHVRAARDDDAVLFLTNAYNIRHKADGRKRQKVNVRKND